MARPLAVLDTTVLVLMLTKKLDESAAEVEADRKRQAVEQYLSDAQAQLRIAVPAVVVAELGRHEPVKAAVQDLMKRLGRFRILPVDYETGCTAAIMAAERLKQRDLTHERGAVKFDTLIAATADRAGAAALVTENPRDFRSCLAAVQSSVEVVVPSEPAKKGQVLIWQQPKK